MYYSAWDAVFSTRLRRRLASSFFFGGGLVFFVDFQVLEVSWDKAINCLGQ
jgi:hypothetical protein